MKLKKFSSFLSEAKFNGNTKDLKYLPAVLKKIKNGVPLRLGASGELGQVKIKYNTHLKNVEKNLNKLKNAHDIVFTGEDGIEYKYSHFFKGDFSGFNNKSGCSNGVSFAGGNNTAIGETLQIISMYLNKPISSFDDIKKLNIDFNELSNIKGLEDKYFNGDECIDAINSVVTSIITTKNSLNLEKYKYIHKNIDEYYKILKNRKLVTALKKENTADVVFYTGKDFLNNLNDEKNEIFYDSHFIEIRRDGKTLNTFVQITLKSGGRLGDSKYLTDMSKEHRVLGEGFLDLFTKIKNKLNIIYTKTSNMVKNIIKTVENKVKGILSKNNKFDKYAKLGFNESKNNPNEMEIWDYYMPGTKNYKKLESEFSVVYHDVLNIINSIKSKLGAGFISSVPKKIIPIPNNPKELRYYYYNLVSLKVLRDYLGDISNISDIEKIETEIVYGNTSLPLVKLDSEKSSVDFLPFEKPFIKTIKPPTLAVKINTSGEHFSFYIYILSFLKSNFEKNNIYYLQIQMRTKGTSQYVIDGNSYKSQEQVMKALS